LTRIFSNFASGNDLSTSDSSSTEVAVPTRARILDPAAIERKLACKTRNVDASRAHIRIIDPDVCLH